MENRTLIAISLIIGSLLLPLGCGDPSGPGSSLAVLNTSLQDAGQNVAYSDTLTATAVGGVVAWAVTVGSLPTGLNLSSGGAITGTPTKVGISNFTVRATTGSLSDQQALSITVNAT